jgi:hypothetical protein
MQSFAVIRIVFISTYVVNELHGEHVVSRHLHIHVCVCVCVCVCIAKILK